MTDDEIDAAFRGAVTARLHEQPASDALPSNMNAIDMVKFAGMGVAMTVNMLRLWAESMGADPTQTWEWIITHGREMGLPGMGS